MMRKSKGQRFLGSPRISVVLAIYCYLISIIIVIGVSVTDPSAVTIQISNLLAQSFLLSLVVRFQSRWLFSPYELLYYTYFVANIIRAMALFPHTPLGTEHAYLGYVSYEDYTYGAILFAVGCFCVMLGSFIPIKLPVLRPDGLSTRMFDPNSPVILIMSVVVLCLLLVIIYQGGDLTISAKRIFTDDSGITTRFGPLRFVLNIAYIYLTLYTLRAAIVGNFGRLAILSMLIGICVSIVISLRVFTLLSVLPILFLILRRSSFRTALPGVFLIPILIFTISYTTAERSARTSDDAGGIIAASTLFMKTVTLSANFGGFVSTSISTRAIGNLAEPLYGSTLVVDPFTQFIPRYIYPQKPEELGGRLRVYQQNAGILPVRIAGGLPPGLFAEFWLNFRWLGVIVLSILLGGIMRGYHERAEGSRNPSYVALLMFLFMAIVFFGFGGHTARLILFVVQAVLAAMIGGLIGRLFGKREDEKQSSTGGFDNGDGDTLRVIS